MKNSKNKLTSFGSKEASIPLSQSERDLDKYWTWYAQAFAQRLQANGLFSSFVKNPCVTGAYAEAWVRSMTRDMLGQRFRISTGAVIQAFHRRVHQCDLIVWDPSEMPAIFESLEFALVPLFATRAIIEVKRKGNN